MPSHLLPLVKPTACMVFPHEGQVALTISVFLGISLNLIAINYTPLHTYEIIITYKKLKILPENIKINKF
nr:MAG TPA: hypothetical protein [Caudoviricetes sp.]